MTTSPKRIQRKRTKGWKKPEGAAYVGRGSQWGNPFVVGQTKWLRGEDDSRLVVFASTNQEAADHFRWYAQQTDEVVARIRTELAGKDLMCWCPLDQPCHADVLLEIANREVA